MFGFTHVLNATTGARYYIGEAIFEGEEYDTTPDGVNAYKIDLQPEDIEGKPIHGLTLAVFNNGYTVQITKNLDYEGTTKVVYSDKYGCDVHQGELVDAIIEGKTLIVTVDKPNVAHCSTKADPRLDLERWQPTEDDRALILNVINDHVTGSSRYAGYESVQEQVELYCKVASNPMAACKEDIQDYFVDAYWCVDGEIEENYGDDEALMQAIRLTISPKEV